MDVVVISSDSSAPSSPTHDFLSGCSSSPPKLQTLSRSTSIRKIPNYNFSSSDCSDTECVANFEKEEPVSEPAITKINIDNLDPRDDNSDMEVCYIETCGEEGHVSPKVKGALNDDLLDKRTHILNWRPQSQESTKSSRKKLSPKELEKRVKEKEEKRIAKSREKALKKAISEAQKSNKPGENLKYIQAQIDQRLLTEEFSGDLLLALQNSLMQYNIQEQIIEKTITWVKTVNNYQFDENDELIITPNVEEANLVLVVMTSNNLIELIKAGKFRYHMNMICQQHEKKKMMLIVYKLEEHFRLQSIQKQRERKAQLRAGSVRYQKTDIDQHVDKTEIEKGLIEIQIFENCGHRFVETPQDLGSLVANFTKALADKDFKYKKIMKDINNLGWCATEESRDTVNVDKNGNGLIRLWKQQLCQFNTASLDTADAIVSLYPSPKSLIQAYENCSTEIEGQLLLQNIKIRRGAGPLSSVLRVGPELSKKIYNFFTARNGDISL